MNYAKFIFFVIIVLAKSIAMGQTANAEKFLAGIYFTKIDEEIIRIVIL